MNMDLGSWSTRVAAAIRAEMAAQRRTSEELARQLGVTEPTVAARLDGQIPFDLVELERVAGWLGLAPSELVARADERAA
jgi:transcriptional regulator with XRE-family HTH domain